MRVIRWLVACAAVAVFVTLSTVRCSSQPSSAVARRITSATDLLTGPKAVGGLGDWYLANDKIALIIDDPNNQNSVAPTGGTVVDFVLLDGGGDAINQIYQIFMLSPSLPLAYDSIAAQTQNGNATIRVTGHVQVTDAGAGLSQTVASALHVETTYMLVPGDASVHVTTTLTNDSGTTVQGFPTLSDVFLWGNRGLNPFEPYRSRGFNHPNLDINNPTAALGSYLYIAAEGDFGMSTSYGTVSSSEPGSTLTGINTLQFSGVGQSPFYAQPLAPGGQIEYERRYLIGYGSIQSIADQAFRILNSEAPAAVPSFGHLAGRIVGIPAGRSAQVIAQLPPDELGPKPMNAITVGVDGGFYFTLPTGVYQLLINYGTMPSQLVGPYTVNAGQITPLADIQVPQLATLAFNIVSDGNAQPARLTMRGSGSTPDPQLGPLYSGTVSNGVAYTLDGSGVVAVEPGTYEVYASRGLEYSLDHQTMTLTAGQTSNANFNIYRVITTPGYLSGDFHVHSLRSLDSTIQPESRVMAFAGEGVSLLVATDHDNLTDYTPTISDLSLSSQIATMVGVESTAFVPVPGKLPNTIGHNAAWPLAYSDVAPRHGAPADEYIEPGVLYERFRAIATSTPVVQLNHPRDNYLSNVGMGYFNNFSYNPTVPIPVTDNGNTNGFLRRITAQGHDNLSFDVMEVTNGTGLDASLKSEEARDDWFSLLRQGIVRTGMANSDSHTTSLDCVGFPRTYVRYAGPGGSAFDADTFDKALLGTHAVGTNGPYITVADANGAGPGDTINLASAGNVTLSINVQAAPWMKVDEVRIFVNGALVASVTTGGVTGSAAAGLTSFLTANPNDPFGTVGVVRYSDNIRLPIAVDSFVTVEAGVLLPQGADLNGDGVLDTWDCNGDNVINANDTAPCAALRAAPTYPLPGVPATSLLNPPPIVHAIVPGMLPWGFTNPIFVHIGDPNTPWVPPGL